MEIIVGKKGQQKIQILDPNVSRRHCKLTVQPDGNVMVEDLDSTNGTFIDGHRIVKMTVPKDTVIQLGPNLKLKISDLIPVAKPEPHVGQNPGSPVAPGRPEPEEYSIQGLEYVWKKYSDRQKEIQETNRQINLLRSASPIFTLGGGALVTLSTVLKWGTGIQSFTVILTFIGLIIMIYSFIKGFKFNPTDEQEKNTTEFQSNYVCPNPKCHRFMGNQPYNLMKQNKNCPYCKCKFKS